MKWWIACTLALLPPLCSAAEGDPPLRGPLVVHVNQVALERTGPKSAIVEASSTLAGAQTSGQFAVLRGDATIQSGTLRALPAFTEWGGGRKYFEADFSSLQVNGSYELQVRLGDAAAKSAPFAVADDALFASTATALLDYFKANRHTNPSDHRIRIFETDRYVDVWGGWKDAGGDNGKYLSHLSYANYFNPQQTAMVVWALGAAHDGAPAHFRQHGLERRVVEEAFWGADYLHRLLDPAGYFYMTVFDRWATPGAERMVVAYVGIEGVYTKDYQAAFREGAGVAIAALARASTLDIEGIQGQFSRRQYLQDAEKAFDHLQKHNVEYCDNGAENIIDDYTALLAATELYRATRKDVYVQAARHRADNLNGRLSSQGWLVSDQGARPYYHAAEAGFPVVSLTYYLQIESDAARVERSKKTIRSVLQHQLALNGAVANPFDYARQEFKVYKDGKLREPLSSGFFIPHANETLYWWQGESARLSSLTTAAVLGGRVIESDNRGPFAVNASLAAFAQHQIDWTLGRNPYDMCLLYGFGARNPPSAISAGEMVRGGISNGITGATASDEGRGITFAPGPDENNWRWLEQWLPHSTWMLLAASAMTNEQVPAQRSQPVSAAAR